MSLPGPGPAGPAATTATRAALEAASASKPDFIKYVVTDLGPELCWNIITGSASESSYQFHILDCVRFISKRFRVHFPSSMVDVVTELHLSSANLGVPWKETEMFKRYMDPFSNPTSRKHFIDTFRGPHPEAGSLDDSVKSRREGPNRIDIALWYAIGPTKVVRLIIEQKYIPEDDLKDTSLSAPKDELKDTALTAPNDEQKDTALSTPKDLKDTASSASPESTGLNRTMPKLKAEIIRTLQAGIVRTAWYPAAADAMSKTPGPIYGMLFVNGWFLRTVFVDRLLRVETVDRVPTTFGNFVDLVSWFQDGIQDGIRLPHHTTTADGAGKFHTWCSAALRTVVAPAMDATAKFHNLSLADPHVVSQVGAYTATCQKAAPGLKRELEAPAVDSKTIKKVQKLNPSHRKSSSNGSSSAGGRGARGGRGPGLGPGAGAGARPGAGAGAGTGTGAGAGTETGTGTGRGESGGKTQNLDLRMPLSTRLFESLRDQRECGSEDQQLECDTEDEDEDEEGIDFFAQMRVLDGLGFKVVFVPVKEMDGFASPAVTSAH